MARQEWDAARRILCVRLDTIGDVLMTTPAIKALKASHRGRHITLLTSAAGAAIARLVPEIDDIIIYDAPWMKATAPRANSQPEFVMLERLRQGNFDAAVIFTVYSQNPLPSVMLCYLADIPLRLAHCHENTYQMLTDWLPDPEPQREIRHEVRRQLDLVAAVGCQLSDERMSLAAPKEDYQRVTALLAASGVDMTRPRAVIHAGATAASRRYAPESFAQVARRLTLEFGWQIIFTGSGDEYALVENIRTMMNAPSTSFVDKLNLGEMTALLKLVPILVANNTGPVHMAAALGTPVIDIYALTNPQHTPWAVPHRVLSHDVPCKYCYKSVCPEGHHNCLRLITPAQVVSATLELFNETAHLRRRPEEILL